MIARRAARAAAEARLRDHLAEAARESRKRVAARRREEAAAAAQIAPEKEHAPIKVRHRLEQPRR